jgi:hypothetical protein
MDERTKKILVVGLFVLSVIGIGTALYFTFFRPERAPEGVTPSEEVAGGAFPESGIGAPPTTTPGGAEPEAFPSADLVARGGTTQTTTLTSGAIENTTIAGGGRLLNYYDPGDGRFYTIDANGTAVELSSQVFPNVESVDWNADGSKAVLEFPDGANVVYDFSSKQQVTLPAHWEDFAFSPVNDEILAKSITIDPGNRWLVTANADGSNVKAIQALGENADKVVMSWSPNDQIVGFANTGDPQPGGIDRKMVIPIGKNQENYKGLVVEGYGFLPNWSTDGKQLLYSVSGDVSELKPLLWVVDGTPGTLGNNRRSLGLNTWADKCTFASATTLYCAVPANLPANSGLARTLFRDTPDYLYKVDIESGRSTLIAIPEEARTLENLSVTGDESALYYTNADTGRLEMIRLK